MPNSHVVNLQRTIKQGIGGDDVVAALNKQPDKRMEFWALLKELSTDESSLTMILMFLQQNKHVRIEGDSVENMVVISTGEGVKPRDPRTCPRT